MGTAMRGTARRRSARTFTTKELQGGVAVAEIGLMTTLAVSAKQRSLIVVYACVIIDMLGVRGSGLIRRPCGLPAPCQSALACR